MSSLKSQGLSANSGWRAAAFLLCPQVLPQTPCALQPAFPSQSLATQMPMLPFPHGPRKPLSTLAEQKFSRLTKPRADEPPGPRSGARCRRRAPGAGGPRPASSRVRPGQCCGRSGGAASGLAVPGGVPGDNVTLLPTVSTSLSPTPTSSPTKRWKASDTPISSLYPTLRSRLRGVRPANSRPTPRVASQIKF